MLFLLVWGPLLRITAIEILKKVSFEKSLLELKMWKRRTVCVFVVDG